MSSRTEKLIAETKEELRKDRYELLEVLTKLNTLKSDHRTKGKLFDKYEVINLEQKEEILKLKIDIALSEIERHESSIKE